MDIESLHKSISKSLQHDAKAVTGIQFTADPLRMHWTMGTDGLLHLDG